MAGPTRQEALATLREGQARLDELLGRIPEDEQTRPATIGGGDWSAKDLIGHIASWEELAMRSLDEWRRGEMPWAERPGGPVTTNEAVDEFNAKEVQEKVSLSLEEVRSRAAQAHAAFLEAIESMPDEEWTSEAGYRTDRGDPRQLVTLLGLLTAAPQRPFGHAFAHIPDLEAFANQVQQGKR